MLLSRPTLGYDLVWLCWVRSEGCWPAYVEGHLKISKLAVYRRCKYIFEHICLMNAYLWSCLILYRQNVIKGHKWIIVAFLYLVRICFNWNHFEKKAKNDERIFSRLFILLLTTGWADIYNTQHEYWFLLLHQNILIH